jgi:hypothetical protein
MNSERLAIVSVLLKIQATLALVAGLIGIAFGMVEPAMRAEGLLTVVLAIAIYVLSRSVRKEARWAIRAIVIIQAIGLVGNLLLAALPIGAIRGPVPLMTNILLPAAVILLIVWRGRHHSASNQVLLAAVNGHTAESSAEIDD